jgi:hypothetical protein
VTFFSLFLLVCFHWRFGNLIALPFCVVSMAVETSFRLKTVARGLCLRCRSRHFKAMTSSECSSDSGSGKPKPSAPAPGRSRGRSHRVGPGSGGGLGAGAAAAAPPPPLHPPHWPPPLRLPTPPLRSPPPLLAHHRRRRTHRRRCRRRQGCGRRARARRGGEVPGGRLRLRARVLTAAAQAHADRAPTQPPLLLNAILPGGPLLGRRRRWVGGCSCKRRWPARHTNRSLP